MADHIIHVRTSREAIRQQVIALAGMISGRVPDAGNVSLQFKLRIAVAFFSKVKEAFVEKARGGRDEAGISWQPLSVRYLAYGRRGVLREVKKAERKFVRDGVNFESQRLYKTTFNREFARLAAQMDRKLARQIASRIALQAAEKKSGKTKLEAAATLRPGADYEILRDTGVLLNSLSPGVYAGEAYTPKTPQQIVRTTGNELIVGTNVAYADTHHTGYATKNIPARPLWPEGHQLPQSWIQDFQAAGRRGLEKALLLLLTGGLKT
jgi:phage gpG-like protein